ncbi:MAG: GTP-binding protein, HflX [Gemmatimonadetes bacterium]|nr:GTP-binding protein, HflX [Gemmatimonadota bacterium]
MNVADPVERVILVAAPRKGSADASHIQEHLDELAQLVDTAGATVIDRMSQQVAAPSPATLIAEGKVAELQALVADKGATLVIFDEELSPVQGANLERELACRVMDRAEVILDILETDRRMIRKKIQYLKRKLVDVAQHRRTVRGGRQAMLHVALVGYTNAGKSSILRALTGEHEIFVENRLFATLDTLTRELDLGAGARVRVTDTVGFIRKLPHHLVASFRATLEEAGEADLLLHVVDASHPEWEEHVEVVQGVLAELGLSERPVLPVFNKIDAVPDALEFATRARALYPGAVFTSTVRTDGMQTLRSVLRERAEGVRPTVRLLVPASDGAKLAAVYRLGEVVGREDLGADVALTVRAEPWQVDRLRETLHLTASGDGDRPSRDKENR